MNSKKLISIIIGTRPEAIKLATVIKAFKKFINLETRIILTGQHNEIVLEVLKIFDLHFDENLLIINKGDGLGQTVYFGPAPIKIIGIVEEMKGPWL